jgi:hypothetical protein
MFDFPVLWNAKGAFGPLHTSPLLSNMTRGMVFPQAARAFILSKISASPEGLADFLLGIYCIIHEDFAAAADQLTQQALP